MLTTKIVENPEDASHSASWVTRSLSMFVIRYANELAQLINIGNWIHNRDRRSNPYRGVALSVLPISVYVFGIT